MRLKLQHLTTLTTILLALFGIFLTITLPISKMVRTLFALINQHNLSNNSALISAIEDYTKSTIIFIIFMWMFFYLYKNYKTYINSFLKKHFLIIKGFGILYVAILAIVPVLKTSLNSYVQLTPYHHIFIYLVIIIVFFCVFISSFDENIMSKQFRIAEILVCLFLCMMGLGLFFFLMSSPN